MAQGHPFTKPQRRTCVNHTFSILFGKNKGKSVSALSATLVLDECGLDVGERITEDWSVVKSSVAGKPVYRRSDWIQCAVEVFLQVQI